MATPDATSIPASLEDLTPDWLTRALHHDASSPRVRSARVEQIGEGEGFLGVIARIHLDYDGDPGTAPRSVIVKLPTRVAENRRLGELLGLYWREIFFYRELAAEVPVRTPIAHHTAFTDDPMRVRQNAVVRVMDKLPGWLVDALMKRARGIVAESPHRYALLIEDLGALRIGDQLRGHALDDCAHVLAAAARLHARFTGDRALARRGWLADPDAAPRIRHRMYLESREGLLARYGEALGREGRRWIEFIDRHGVAIAKRAGRDAPPTLVHGDLRLDNVFFDDAGSVPAEVVLADWQLVGRGAGAHDVAYLLSGALDADISAAVERELLEHYHGALVAAGLGGYTLNALVRDYRRGLLSAFQTLCSPGDMDLGESRGDTLMQAWIERTLARLRDVPADGFA